MKVGFLEQPYLPATISGLIPLPAFTVKYGAEFLSQPSPPPDWLVTGLLPHPQVTMMVGEGGTYKSFFAQDLAIALATGTSLLGTFTVPTPRTVAYLQTESAEESFRKRLQTLIRGRGLRDEDVGRRLIAVTNQPIRLDVRSHVEWIRSKLLEHAKPDLIIIDPLRDFHTSEENSSTELQPIMSAIRSIRDEFQCSVLIVHHSSKAGNSQRGPSKVRGSNVMWFSMDGRWEFSRTSGGWINVIPGQKEYGGIGDFRFRPEIDEIETTFFVQMADQSAASGGSVTSPDVLKVIRRLGSATVEQIHAELPSISTATIRRRISDLEAMKRVVVSSESTDGTNRRKNVYRESAST